MHILLIIHIYFNETFTDFNGFYEFPDVPTARLFTVTAIVNGPGQNPLSNIYTDPKYEEIRVDLIIKTRKDKPFIWNWFSLFYLICTKTYF